MFFCEFYGIYKSTIFTKQRWATILSLQLYKQGLHVLCFLLLLQNVWKQLFSRTPVWWPNTEAGTRGVLLKNVLLKNFMIFTGKHLRPSLFLIRLEVWRPATFYKENPTQVFSCEYSKLFKSNFFKRTPSVAAFVVGQLFWRASANDCFCHQYHGNLRTRCI